jgi:hypothetical protein
VGLMTDGRRQQFESVSASLNCNALHFKSFHCKSFQVKSSRWSYYSLCSGLAQAVHSRVAIASQLRLDRCHRALHTHKIPFRFQSICPRVELSLPWRMSLYIDKTHGWQTYVAFTPFDCLAPSPSLPTGRGPSLRSASRGWLSRQTPARPRLRLRQRQHPLP